MNRLERRQAQFKRGQRYGAHSAHAQDTDILHNRIAQALVRARIMDQVHQLRTRAGVHAYIGDDTAHLADAMGRLVFTVAHAAGLHNLGDTPEASILRGCANALAHIAALEQQRGAITSGLAAIERLLPELHEFSLAAGALELDNLLHSANGMGTADVRKALGMRA